MAKWRCRLEGERRVKLGYFPASNLVLSCHVPWLNVIALLRQLLCLQVLHSFPGFQTWGCNSPTAAHPRTQHHPYGFPIPYCTLEKGTFITFFLNHLICGCWDSDTTRAWKNLINGSAVRPLLCILTCLGPVSGQLSLSQRLGWLPRPYIHSLRWTASWLLLSEWVCCCPITVPLDKERQEGWKMQPPAASPPDWRDISSLTSCPEQVGISQGLQNVFSMKFTLFPLIITDLWE